MRGGLRTSLTLLLIPSVYTLLTLKTLSRTVYAYTSSSKDPHRCCKLKADEGAGSRCSKTEILKS